MPRSSYDASTVLRLASQFLRSLDDADVAALTAGRKRLALVDATTRASPPTGPRVSDVEIEALAEQLSRMPDRQAVLDALTAAALRRPQLEALARRFDIPAGKSQNMERLRARLAEAAVGFRIRSEAVSGTRDRAGEP